MGEAQLNRSNWIKVVLVAGIGTILEWFDFYIYTQLSATLGKVFFPSDDKTAQDLSYWGVFAAAFVVRPLGALLFGHIGDKYGRNLTLMISIICMAVPTFLIGLLPTYNTGDYYISPHMLAPILLALLRMCQGFAMGGEFGSAVIYISELADSSKRGLYVALLQSTVNIGMMLATILVMILENTLSEDEMLNWGWRIPFLLAFCTALLGFVLRKGMPEPHAFLAAARAEKALEGKSSGDLESLPSQADMSIKNASGSEDGSEETAPEKRGALEGLHGQSHSKVPIFRLLKNNWAGVIIQVLFMCWISGAFYITVSWLMAGLRKNGMKPINSQGLLIVSLLFNAAGLISVGKAFDNGVRAIHLNAGITFLGVTLGFGIFYGVNTSQAAAWCLVCLFQLIIGAAMAVVVLPSTRIYAPLERTTGFSFAYNCGYGVIGGLSPMIVTAIKASMSPATACYAPAWWLFALGVLSFIGCGLLNEYMPKINKKYVGHIE